MCTERAPSALASTCPGKVGLISAAEMSQQGRSCQDADAVHGTAAPAAVRSMQGLAWQLASALAARTVGQQLKKALQQAVPAALGIRCTTAGPY
jgi:hypothetical protein